MIRPQTVAVLQRRLDDLQESVAFLERQQTTERERLARTQDSLHRARAELEALTADVVALTGEPRS